MSNSPKKRIASSEWRIEAVRALAILVLTFRLSLFASRHPLLLSLFATRHSLFASFIRPPPMRSVRSAGGARMPARHPSRHAMTGMQTPHRFAQTGRTRLAFIAHHGRARRAIDLRNPGQPTRLVLVAQRGRP